MSIASYVSGLTGWAARYLWAGWAGAAGLLCLLAAWQAGHEFYGSVVLPSPQETAAAVGALIREPEFAELARTTALRAFTGFLIAGLFGTALGAACGYFFAVMRAARPIVTVILGVPPIAWVVLALIWFGSTGGSAVMTVVVAAFPIAFAGAFEGVATRSRPLDAMARAFGVPPAMRFRTVTLPHLVSYLFPAWTTIAGTAWKVTVMAELLSNSGGIGGDLATSRALFDIPRVMALIVVIVIFALFTEFGILHPIRDRLEKWRDAGVPWGVKR